jgi:alpha-D-ribose 1-methylphosphonate 5-triphosphate diphosphatase
LLRAINNATVVTPEAVLEGASVVLEEGRIAGVLRRAERSGETLDAGGHHVVPALVDLHSDAIEAQLSPRPGVDFPPELALVEMDRYFASAGIGTGFHAIAFVEGGGRTVARAREHYALIAQHRHEVSVRHELHLRCEVAQQSALEAVEALLPEHVAKIASLMDHTLGQGQLGNLAWYEENGRTEDLRTVTRMGDKVEGDPWALGRLQRVAHAAKDGGAVLASHDDDVPERVALLARRGVRISEFPVNVDAARKARELGLTVCMGAPNVVRDRSSGGNLLAREAVARGLVDVLVSDYHPPSMLQAAFGLARRGTLPLPHAVALVSAAPARAVGLAERGEIREGALADLAVVGKRLEMPVVTHTIVGGDVVFAYEIASVSCERTSAEGALSGSCP